VLWKSFFIIAKFNLLFLISGMEKNRPHWMVNPTKKQVVLIGIVWFAGILLTTISVTNVFVENPFQRKSF
jgi:hypothetical protein